MEYQKDFHAEVGGDAGGENACALIASSHNERACARFTYICITNNQSAYNNNNFPNKKCSCEHRINHTAAYQPPLLPQKFVPCKPIALQLSNNKFMIDFESLKENDIFILEIISFIRNFNELARWTVGAPAAQPNYQFPLAVCTVHRGRVHDNFPNRAETKAIDSWIYNDQQKDSVCGELFFILSLSSSIANSKKNHALTFSKWESNWKIRITYANSDCHHAYN